MGVMGKPGPREAISCLVTPLAKIGTIGYFIIGDSPKIAYAVVLLDDTKKLVPVNQLYEHKLDHTALAKLYPTFDYPGKPEKVKEKEKEKVKPKPKPKEKPKEPKTFQEAKKLLLTCHKKMETFSSDQRTAQSKISELENTENNARDHLFTMAKENHDLKDVKSQKDLCVNLYVDLKKENDKLKNERDAMKKDHDVLTDAVKKLNEMHKDDDRALIALKALGKKLAKQKALALDELAKIDQSDIDERINPNRIPSRI